MAIHIYRNHITHLIREIGIRNTRKYNDYVEQTLSLKARL